MEEYVLEKGCSPLLTLSTAAVIASKAEVKNKLPFLTLTPVLPTPPSPQTLSHFIHIRSQPFWICTFDLLGVS